LQNNFFVFKKFCFKKFFLGESGFPMSLKEKLEAATRSHAKPSAQSNAFLPPEHHSAKKQITITLPSISVRATKHFQAKMPFLLLLLLIFSFSLVMFEKANFHASDLVDFNRLQYNIPKLWSVSFIVFLLLFALALAIAVFYGFGQGWLPASIVLPITIIPAIVISLFYPTALMLPFIVFALSVTSAALTASLFSIEDGKRVSTIWTTLGIAMLLFVALTFTVSFVKIASNKDAFVNQFIESGIAAGLTGFSGTTSTSSELSIDFSSLLTPDAVKKAVTRDKIARVITTERVKNALLNGIPGWNSIQNRSVFEENVRQELIDTLYANVGTDIPTMLSNLRIQPSGTPAQGPTQAPTQLSSSVKEVLGRMTWFVAFYNNFSLVMALLVTSIAAFFGFIARVFAVFFAWLLNKLY